jgi:hypothetical protein
METNVTWILGLPLILIFVVAIAMEGTTSVRRDGAVLTAHQAGLVGGRSVYGPGQGYAQAGSDLSAWWGLNEPGQAVVVVEDPDRRSLQVTVRGWMGTLFGGRADLGAGSFQRWEGFYTGPPAEFE